MKSFAIIILILAPIALQAQSKKQRKALAEQIVKLQLYLGYVKKGYNILDKGLTTIGNIKNNDWTLHRLFLDKRKTVSPKIKSYGRIAAIIATQSQLNRTHRKWKDELMRFSRLPPQRSAYYQNVSGHSLGRTANLLSELLQLITDGRFQLTDPERIERIELIYTQHRKEAEKLITFCNQSLSNSAHQHQQATQLRRLQQQY